MPEPGRLNCAAGGLRDRVYFRLRNPRLAGLAPKRAAYQAVQAERSRESLRFWTGRQLILPQVRDPAGECHVARITVHASIRRQLLQ